MKKHEVERCGVEEQDLLLYHYRELNADGMRRIESHLDGCARCRRRLDEFAATLAAATAEEPEWSGADQRRFCARIDERIQRRRRPAGLWIGGVVTAAALMVALVLPWRLEIPEQLTAPPQPTMMAELEMLDRLDFLQTLDLLEILEFLEEMEPIG